MSSVAVDWESVTFTLVQICFCKCGSGIKDTADRGRGLA